MVLIKALLFFSLCATSLAQESSESIAVGGDAVMVNEEGQLKTGRVRETPIDRAVKRVLSHRFDATTKALRDAVRQIESQLVREVDLHEPEPNLERLIELLEETEDTSGIPASRLDGLQLLVSLNKVWRGDSKCNHESHTILSKNNEALMGAVQVPASRFPARPSRMQALLRKIAVKHANACKYLYAQTYDRLLHTFPSDFLETVKTFIDLISEVHIKRSKPSWSLFGGWTAKLEPSDVFNAQKMIKSFKSVAGRDEAEIAYDFLKNYIQEEPDQWYLTRVPVSETDNTLVLNRDKIRHLLWRHLIEPCASYVNFMGPEVFEPAEFDAQILDNDDRHLRAEMHEFQRARVRYNLCKRLVQGDEKELFKGIVGVASKAPIHQFS